MNKPQKRFTVLEKRKKANLDLFYAKKYFKKAQRVYSKIERELASLKKDENLDLEKIISKQEELILAKTVLYKNNSEVVHLQRKIKDLNKQVDEYKKVNFA